MLPTIINSEFEITNMFQQKTSCDEYLAQLNQKENIQSKIYAMNNSISEKKGKQINKIKELLINPQYKKNYEVVYQHNFYFVCFSCYLCNYVHIFFNYCRNRRTYFCNNYCIDCCLYIMCYLTIITTVESIPTIRTFVFILLPFKSKYNSKYEKQIDSDKAQIVKYKQQLGKIEAKMEEIASYLRAECVIPEPYWIYASELCYLIQVKRANNLTSAINLLEDIFHKLRMENAQFQQIDMLKCNNEELQKIKESIRNIHITTSTYVKVKCY